MNDIRYPPALRGVLIAMPISLVFWAILFISVLG